MKHLYELSGVTAALGLLASPASAATLQVGPGQTYAMPCDAIAAAQAGDTIQVDASGSYNGNTCSWSTDGLTITGVNGQAKIDLTGVTPSGEKGIFTIEGTASATIENFELSGAAISADAGNNGAGIRHQGLNLTVRNCYIHDNQDGILAAPATPNTGTVLIENSEFESNGAGDGYSHNMYIGNYAQFTLQYSWSHLAKVGHLVKSRAFTTSILYNRITDELGGTASYEIDIPNGGTGYVIGNIIEQSAATQNPNIISFAEEGTPAGYDTHLFVVNNTVLNDLGSGTYVVDATTTPASIVNNIFHGGGTDTAQSGAVLTTNFDDAMGDPMFVDAANYNVALMAGSPCIDKGTAAGTNGSQSLTPGYEYVQPLSDVARSVAGSAIDIGAFEYGDPSDGGIVQGGGDAGTTVGDAGSGTGSVLGDGGEAGAGSGTGSAPPSSGPGSGTGKGTGSGGTANGTGGDDAGLNDSPGASGSGGCSVTRGAAGDSATAVVAGLLLALGGNSRRSSRRRRRA